MDELSCLGPSRCEFGLTPPTHPMRHPPLSPSTRFSALLCSLAMSCVASLSGAAELPVKTGEKVAFMGESITAGGFGNPGGYVRLVMLGLEANGVKAGVIPAGVSGHKSNQMLARLENDVLNKKPQWMTLSCGVNDVWHGANGVPLDAYKSNINAILDKCQQAGVKVMILTSTMIGETPGDNNTKLIVYNDFLRATAKERHLLLADLSADMQQAVTARAAATGAKPGWLLTMDGVHMNPVGDEMMATGVLKAFGLDDAQMQKARAAWATLRSVTSINVSVSLSMQQFQQLSLIAGKQGKSVGALLGPELNKELDAVIKNTAAK